MRSARERVVRMESHVWRNDATDGRRSSDTARPTLPRKADEKQHQQRQQHRTGQRLPATFYFRHSSTTAATAATRVAQLPVMIQHRSSQRVSFQRPVRHRSSRQTRLRQTFVVMALRTRDQFATDFNDYTGTQKNFTVVETTAKLLTLNVALGEAGVNGIFNIFSGFDDMNRVLFYSEIYLTYVDIR